MGGIFKKSFPILAIGVGAGFLSGLLGAGGGIVIVVGLSFLCRRALPDRRTVFASTTAVMLPLSLFSSLQYFKNGNMVADGVSFLVMPAILGGALGALIVGLVGIMS